MPTICIYPSCLKYSSYGTVGEKPIYCAIHKEGNHVNLRTRKCAYDGCTVCPSFNSPGSKVGIYCVSHKGEGHVNVMRKLCSVAGCIKTPAYNTPESKTGMFCTDHKLPGHICVRVKTCRRSMCSKSPKYNVPGSNHSIYCTDHKLPGMVLLRICVHPNCNRRASFNVPGAEDPLHCKLHRSTEHVNVVKKRHTPEDQDNAPQPKAKRATCDSLKCLRFACYGAPGKSANRCFEHKKGGFVRCGKSNTTLCESCGFAVFNANSECFSTKSICEICKSLRVILGKEPTGPDTKKARY